jgi:hypothetical protein
MKIGACGIACEVCGLYAKDACSGCTHGDDENVSLVLGTQKKRFGMVCPVLECASGRKVGHCLKDCDIFPCDLLGQGYPYGKAWLSMFKQA